MDTLELNLLENELPVVGECRDASLPTSVSQSNKDEDVFTFVISKEETDRHGSIVTVSGIDVSDFKNNPVVLFNHNYDKVIGSAYNIRVQGDTLIADMRFAETAFAQEIKGQVQRGEIRATSIGFMIKEWDYDEDSDTYYYTKTELLEFSIVSVPSNRNSLIMRDARKQVKTLTEQLKALEGLAQRLEKAASLVLNDKSVSNEPAPASEKDTPTNNTRDDQSDQEVSQFTSTPNASDARDEIEDPADLVPDEAQKSSEKDLNPSTEPPPLAESGTENTPGAVSTSRLNPSSSITLEDAMRLARQVVRRELGKE